MYLFKCVWFMAVGVAVTGLAYIFVPLDWLLRWDRRQAAIIERRLGGWAIPFYFRGLGVVMLLAGGFIAVGLVSVFR